MIAIVDDDEAVRVATESLVRSLGFQTATFATAQEFLDDPRLDETDCLITDIQMPGMSGHELQTHLLEHGKRFPMIFITGFPADHIRIKVEASGAIGFLSKPFDGSEMIGCIDKALCH